MPKRIGVPASFVLVTLVFLTAFFNFKKADDLYILLLSLPVLMLTAFFFDERGIIHSVLVYASALAVLFTFMYKLDLKNSSFVIGAFWLVSFGVVIARGLVKKVFKMYEDELKSEKSSYAELSGKFRGREDERTSLDKQIMDIGRLYDISKKMSRSLKFGDIFPILSQFIKDNFSISKIGLVLLDYTKAKNVNEDSFIKIVYEVDNAGNTKEVPHEALSDYNRLVRTVFEDKDKKALFCGNDTVVPLIVERRIIAILTARGLKKEDFERFQRFLILAGQFALQLKKVALYEHVEALSITDSLTDTYRRNYFVKRLKEELERSERLHLGCSLLIADIDHFKDCNDTFGHLVGDVALKEIASIIKKNIREVDLLARYGGEEFSVILPETDLKGATRVAERIREAIHQRKISAYDEVFKLTLSIGISYYPEDSRDPDDLIDKADQALYKAKEAGRNKVVAWRG